MESAMIGASCTIANSGMTAWALLAAVALHELEEFVWPGGFRAWYIGYSPHVERSVTSRFLWTINLAVALAAAIAGAYFAAPWARFLWLAVAGGVGINAVWHIRASVRGRRYSPGVVTGALVYLPLVSWAFVHFVRCRWVAPSDALTALAYGGTYWILSEGRKLLKSRTAQTSGRPNISVLR
jgi:Protein of unknown function with HXXEE motif